MSYPNSPEWRPLRFKHIPAAPSFSIFFNRLRHFCFNAGSCRALLLSQIDGRQGHLQAGSGSASSESWRHRKQQKKGERRFPIIVPPPQVSDPRMLSVTRVGDSERDGSATDFAGIYWTQRSDAFLLPLSMRNRRVQYISRKASAYETGPSWSG